VRSSIVTSTSLVGLAIGLGIAVPLARGDAKAPTIGTSEIKEGMKGYGLSVFHGTVPERFDVEVIGVLHNFLPAQELVLIKTPNNDRLAIAKGVHGMSGSPIYLDGGRLAGAYSYIPGGGSFPAEPVVGFTPIAPMLAEMKRPMAPGFWPLDSGRALPPATQGTSLPGSPTAFAGPPGSYDLEAHAAQLAATMASLRGDPTSLFVPAGTPLMVAGMGDRATQYLRKLVAPMGIELQGGGGGQADLKPGELDHFVDGGSFGVEFIGGDMTAYTMGTVTHVEGHRLVGFGHPMFGAGDSDAPAALARILWINASLASSSKVAEMIRPLGAVIQDRRSGVVADDSLKAPMFPMTVEIRGGLGVSKKSWSYVVAEDHFTAIEGTVSERRDVTWRLDSKVTVRGHGTVTLEDYGVAMGGMPDPGDFSHAHVVRTVGDVLNNPWEHVHVDKVESVLSLTYTRDLWHLRGVEALEDAVDAGAAAHLVLHLVPFVGPEITKTIDVTMPAELAGKDVDVEVLPGYELSPDLPAPENLTELLANEPRTTAMPKSIVVQFRVPSEGVTFNGHVASRLPPFALDSLRPAHSDVGPEPFAAYQRKVVPVEQYIDGKDHTHVKVRAVVR
jgi:hypothetical protein